MRDEQITLDNFLKIGAEEIVLLNSMLVKMLNPEQFNDGVKLAEKFLEAIQKHERGPALFALLMVVQIICEQWRDERATRQAAGELQSKYIN